MKKVLAILILTSLFSTFADAKTIPRARTEDRRIREVWFSETQVVEIPTSFGISTTIEFGNETIKTAVTGDSIGWQVIPQGNRLFIKPAEKAQAGLMGTNLTVITDKRNYYLHLYIQPRTNPVFIVRYRYDKPPAPPTAATVEASNDNDTTPTPSSRVKKYRNYNYKMSGAKSIKINRVFDDGEFTYFEFDPRQPLPAIYAINRRGNDELVNVRTEGKYTVVEKVARGFTLRDGNLHKCVKNEFWAKEGE